MVISVSFPSKGWIAAGRLGSFLKAGMPAFVRRCCIVPVRTPNCLAIHHRLPFRGTAGFWFSEFTLCGAEIRNFAGAAGLRHVVGGDSTLLSQSGVGSGAELIDEILRERPLGTRGDAEQAPKLSNAGVAVTEALADDPVDVRAEAFTQLGRSLQRLGDPRRRGC